MRLGGLAAAALLAVTTSAANAAEVIANRVDSADASFRVVKLLGSLENPWSMS